MSKEHERQYVYELDNEIRASEAPEAARLRWEIEVAQHKERMERRKLLQESLKASQTAPQNVGFAQKLKNFFGAKNKTVPVSEPQSMGPKP